MIVYFIIAMLTAIIVAALMIKEGPSVAVVDFVMITLFASVAGVLWPILIIPGLGYLLSKRL